MAIGQIPATGRMFREVFQLVRTLKLQVITFFLTKVLPNAQ